MDLLRDQAPKGVVRATIFHLFLLFFFPPSFGLPFSSLICIPTVLQQSVRTCSAVLDFVLVFKQSG